MQFPVWGFVVELLLGSPINHGMGGIKFQEAMTACTLILAILLPGESIPLIEVIGEDFGE